MIFTRGNDWYLNEFGTNLIECWKITNDSYLRNGINESDSKLSTPLLSLPLS